MTQVHLAKILRVKEAAVSKIERRADMYASTLHDFVKAIGGYLKITAKFPEGTVEITQFEVVKESSRRQGIKRSGLRRRGVLARPRRMDHLLE